MPRIFVDTQPQNNAFVLAGEDAHYVSAVLRARPADLITIVGPTGSVYHTRVVSVAKGRVEAEVLEIFPSVPEPAHGIVLLAGMLKGKKMDLVVQKAVELGVMRIVPLVTERAQVRETRKSARWQTISREAARQCGRTVVPEVEKPQQYDEFFSSCKGALAGFIFWEEGGEPLGADVLPTGGQDVYVCIGPEGGLTPEEVDVARAAGLRVVGLGPRILRAETAAITGVALVQFLLGGMGGGQG
jgi:16S rRNA (uracil1498-N3)-methyltransferase